MISPGFFLISKAGRFQNDLFLKETKILYLLFRFIIALEFFKRVKCVRKSRLKKLNTF